MSETAAPYYSGCRQPCSEHTVCPGSARTYALGLDWQQPRSAANTAEIVYQQAESVTLSRTDAELIERLAWVGYRMLSETSRDDERRQWQDVLVRLATALA